MLLVVSHVFSRVQFSNNEFSFNEYNFHYSLTIVKLDTRAVPAYAR